MGKTLIVERDVATPMRDGVILRADVYRPDSPERLPVLLSRTPYGKGLSSVGFALIAAERGYAVVIQDTRGCWASEGKGYPFIHEKADGYDTVEWAAAQPWSNGSIGMFGSSYIGYTQLAAASQQPPSLKTITPAITFFNPVAVSYSNGVLHLGVAITWNLMLWALLAISRYQGNPLEKAMLMGQLIQIADGMSTGETFKHLPLTDLPIIGRDGISPLVSDVYNHPPEDEYWKAISIEYDRIKIPVLHIGGWYDMFTSELWRDYLGLSQQGNNQQKVLVGPWYHGSYDSLAGEVDFGLLSSGVLVLPDEIMLRWFDYWLKGIDNGIMREPPLQIFVMGINQWRTENEWPLARTQYTPYYLHSSGSANTLNGDGKLNTETPSQEPVGSYVYDPRNPVPTRGGGLLGWSSLLRPGAYDQREIEARQDVLVYTSSPLEADLEVTGPVEVHLWAASTAPDTDFTAKLVDVDSSGFARNITDGIIRARYQQRAGNTLFKPGTEHEFTFQLPPTSNVFLKSHFLRLEIASSNFPHYDRNHNTGKEPGEDAELCPALQSILHDAEHPSHIILPVITKGES
ncbi:MAG: CocE/NonD family hydrolase [Omnitrophica WOR_2 bacterium]